MQLTSTARAPPSGAHILLALLLLLGLSLGSAAAYAPPAALDAPAGPTTAASDTLFFPLLTMGGGQPLRLARIASGIQAPTYVTTPPGDTAPVCGVAVRPYTDLA
ncbi:MAG: hypothetical protein HZY76_14220 [Anaerolineae bacterium]|nr:MAG: hypothetical protein HZY76_14220 [Anaerolineae bacterium]